MNAKMVYRGRQLISDRRRRERCPKCQFLAALTIIVSGALLLLFLFNTLPRYTSTSDFLISSANTYEAKNKILVDADLSMNFSADVIEALENGIPLTIAVEVQVFRERPWWRNIIIKESLQLFELRYHPLTDVHEVKNIASGARYSFNSREDAMATLGTIRGASLIEKKMLTQPNRYYAQIRTLLDISYLPTALRQIASLSSSWRLESPWYRWEIDTQAKNHIVIDPIDSNEFEPQLQSHNPTPQSVPEPAPSNATQAPVAQEPAAQEQKQ
jgi:hypothetical protein